MKSIKNKLKVILPIILILALMVYPISTIANTIADIGIAVINEHKIIRSLPHYYDCDEYYDPNAWMDSTDFCMYYYKDVDKKTLDNNKYFKKVKQNDIKQIGIYLNHFDETVENRDEKEKYTFKKSQVEEGDYFCITGKDNSEYYNPDFYNIYYFDLSENTLYYMHSDN